MRTLMVTTLIATLGMGCTQKQNTLSALIQMQVAPPPQTVTVQMNGYTPVTGRKFGNLFVSNFSVKASQSQLYYMTARDGLPDVVKQAHVTDYGFGITGPNTANPNFSDLVLYLAGITTSSQGLLYCPANLATSSSNDAIIYTDSRTNPPSTQFLGLRDCEKLYLGLNPTSFDFDGDGIPDYLELRCGLNPKNANDAPLNITGDGVANIDKCKQGLPVDENANSQANTLFSYNYNMVVQNDGSRTFTVSNIPVLNGGQDNLIAFYLTEVNATTQQSYLYTAFAILKAGSAGQILKFNFWGSTTTPSQNYNQEITFQ
jgi:hypothetical protein